MDLESALPINRDSVPCMSSCSSNAQVRELNMEKNMNGQQEVYCDSWPLPSYKVRPIVVASKLSHHHRMRGSFIVALRGRINT